MSNQQKFRLLPVSLAVSVAIAATSSFAIADEQSKVERLEVKGSYTVEEVIDTATGLGLTLRETPQSVSILTSTRLQDQNISTLLETVNNAVGISATEMDNVRSEFKARGFTIDSFQIDGIPVAWSLAGDSGETVTDVSIYERIEFVRGATGLLTGAGEPSASVNLVRKHANSSELTGYVDVAVGSRNKKQITADVSNGLNESGTVRGRVVAKYLDTESHVDFYDESKTVLYGVVEADLSAATLLRAGASYQDRDPKGAVWGALPGAFADGSLTDWPVSKTTAADWSQWKTKNTNYFVNLDHRFSNGWQLLTNYNHMKFEKDSKMLYLYGALDKDSGEGLIAQRYNAAGETVQDSIDIQLKGDFRLFEQQHEFVIGAMSSKQEIEGYTYEPIGGESCGGYDCVPVGNFYEWQGLPQPDWESQGVKKEDITIKQKGVYAATRLSATDKLKFIIGGRISSWDREGYFWSDVREDYGDSGVFVPYAGALYDLTENHRLYASYTEIFKSQNARDVNKQMLDPLEGNSYEIGLKSSFLNDRLHTNVALFRINQDNLAVQDPNHTPTAEQPVAYYGADGTESKGFELEVVGKPLDGWNISAGYSKFEAEDAAGNKVNTDSPRKQFKLFSTYQFIDYLPELTVGGGVNWQSEAYADGAVRLTQSSYALVNLMARYELTDDMNLQLNVANLFDKKYYNYLVYGSYRYGTPRNVTLSFNYSF